MVQLIAVLVTGLCIGWLSGLSVSPVIASVLASVVGIAGGLVAGLRGSGDSASRSRFSSIDAWPAAVLLLGIAAGAPLGILARTHQLFEPSSAPVRTDTTAQGVLFNVATEDCDRLRARARDPNEKAFRDVLAATGKWGRLLDAHVTDTTTLKAIVEDICKSGN